MSIEVVRERLARVGVLPVVTLPCPGDAVDVGRALLAGGIDVVEVTMRAPGATEAIAKLRTELPDLFVAAGTVTSPDEVAEVVDAGAAFALAPGSSPTVLDAAADAGLPFIPGVATPTEIEVAMARGLRLLKLFPASTIGGATAARALLEPYRHLGLELLPTGGVRPTNVADYLAVDGVIAVGGTWLAAREVLERRDWTAVTTAAREASTAVAS